MKFDNFMILEFPSKSCNEAFARAAVACFAAQMDPTLEECARIAGAKQFYVIRKVTLPLIMPAVISGMMLAAAMSIDDVVISFFVTSAETTTLPLKVYTGLRSGGTPEINALSTLMLGAIFVIVGLSQLLRARSDKKLYSSK